MPDTVNGVIIIGLIMAPGYLTLWVARQATSHAYPWSEVEFIVATIAVGIIVQGLLFPFLGKCILSDWADHQIDNELNLGVWLALSLLLIPSFLGIGIAKIVARDGKLLHHFGLDRLTRTPRAFHIALGRRDGCFVRVFLTQPENKIIVGRLSNQSRGSTDPSYPDLYLEEVWYANERDYPMEIKPFSKGMWFSPSSIARIEFIEGVFEDVPSESTSPDNNESNAPG